MLKMIPGRRRYMARYIEITCETACNKLKRQMPFQWDLNIYRGCQHECKYCFAMYSHTYLHSNQFFGDIYVKTNIVEKLEKQLRSSSWKKEVINIGGVTDSYQPAEKKYQMMPEILKLLLKYQTPCIISTKSDLILRDFDLIAALAEKVYVNIAATITCIDEDIRKRLEPGGAPSQRRFEVLQAFSKTKASTGLHIMPLVPYLTDIRENIEGLYSMGKASNVDYVLSCVMNLRGRTRAEFFRFIKTTYPKLYQPISILYQAGRISPSYKNNLYKIVHEMQQKYHLTDQYKQPLLERLALEPKQLSLFDSFI